MRQVLFTEEALHDYEEARRWYTADREGRDARFAAAIDVVLLHVQHAPSSFPSLVRDYRRAVVKRFPYTIVFTFDEARVVIHAVFHNAQSPKRLRYRLRTR